jgi:catechol 2,3-dioxygenase-like lactoylglutathione lyase family enzyme
MKWSARMAEWKKQLFALNLPVGDLEQSKNFYQEVFGLLPLDEEEDLALFRLEDKFFALRREPAHPTVPADALLSLARQGVGQFSIVVDDVDAVGAELESKGVTLISAPADRPWGMRTLAFADPGGYTWSIAQDLP